MRTCDIEGCERKHLAKGMCANHYTNERRKVVGREPETKANSAEMLARNYMVQRIADLEAALSLIDPSHPLLDEVSTSLVA